MNNDDGIRFYFQLANQWLLQNQVSPLLCGGKRPLGSWAEYMKNGVTKDSIQRDAIKHGDKVTGVGVILGAASGNLIDLDVDSVDTARIEQVRSTILAACPALASTMYKGGKGLHCLFRLADGVEAKHNGKLIDYGDGEHVELRANGHQSIAPGSIHPSGAVYAWSDPDVARAFDLDLDLPAIPVLDAEQFAELEAALKALSPSKPESAVKPKPTPQIDFYPPENKYEHTAQDVMDRWNETHSIETALRQAEYIEGKKPGFFCHAQDSNKDGSAHLISDGLVHLFGANDPLAGMGAGNDGRTFDSFGIYTASQHGGNAKEAIKAAAQMLGMNSTPKTKIKTTPILAAESISASPENIRDFADLDNLDGPQAWAARQFVRLYKDRIIFATEYKSWFVWNERYWKRDILNKVKGSIFMDYFLAELRKMAEQVGGKDGETIAKIASSKLGSNTAIDAVLAIASSMVGVSVSQFDQERHTLNVKNGIVDLKTGKLSEHRRDLYFTSCLDIDFVPDASCPIWERSMAQVTKSESGKDRPDLCQFLQKCLGYCITGDVSSQVMMIAYGRGRNGKSFTLDYVRQLIGAYGCVAPQSLLLQPRGGFGQSNSYDEAVLQNKRMAVASETSEGERFDTAKVKRLTGNQTIRARNPYEKAFEFPATHKLLIDCNYQPVIREMDEGTWRRIIVLPFDYQLDYSEIDHSINLKWDGEKSGILNWLVAGAMRYYEEKLAPDLRPDCCNVAQQDYKTESDTLASWLEECIEADNGNHIATKELYAVYTGWAKANGHREQYLGSVQTLTKRLKERGYSYKRTKTARGFSDIAISEAGFEYHPLKNKGYQDGNDDDNLDFLGGK